MPDVNEIFAAMATNVDADKLDGIDVSIVWSLSGDEPGDWTVAIADGALNTSEGSAESPDATLSMDSDDFKDLISGELNPMMAFMQGKVKVDGDMGAVMKIQGLLG